MYACESVFLVQSEPGRNLWVDVDQNSCLSQCSNSVMNRLHFFSWSGVYTLWLGQLRKTQPTWHLTTWNNAVLELSTFAILWLYLIQQHSREQYARRLVLVPSQLAGYLSHVPMNPRVSSWAHFDDGGTVERVLPNLSTQSPGTSKSSENWEHLTPPFPSYPSQLATQPHSDSTCNLHL